jgi:hypothetical protein
VIAVDRHAVAFSPEKGRDVETLGAARRSRPLAARRRLRDIERTAGFGAVERIILALPILAIADGYWERRSPRRRLFARRLRVLLADVLICQSCLDHDLAW